MSPRPCDAIREIEVGAQPVECFAQPRVFESGLYETYGVTIADIRQHLRDCKPCAASRHIAQSRLNQYDHEEAESLDEKLITLDALVNHRLENEQSLAKSSAECVASDYGKDFPEESLEEAIIEDYSRSFFEESEPRVYLWAIKIHAVIGELVFRWLETMVPPSIPRQTFLSDSKVTNIRLQDGDLDSRLKAAFDAPGLLRDSIPRAGSLLVRALLLHRAFRGILPQLEQLKALFADIRKPINKDEQTFGVDWRAVWENYSSLANSIAATVLAGVGGVQLGTPQTATLTSVSKNDLALNIKEIVDDLLQGQTATMVQLMEMGKDLSQIRIRLSTYALGDESSSPKQVPLLDLIATGESGCLEFKASLRWDHRFQKVNKDLQEVVAKAVAGMLNTHGGTLLVGVKDDGAICGIEQDLGSLGRKDLDGFGQALNQVLCDFLGPEFADLHSAAFESTSGKTVCRISVRRSPEPVFLNGAQGREFYIRTGNTTRKLDADAAHRYILRNWPPKD